MNTVTTNVNGTYIWLYEAKSAHGKIKGRVQARSYTQAVNRVKELNLMIDEVTAKLHQNQSLARKERYEV